MKKSESPTFYRLVLFYLSIIFLVVFDVYSFITTGSVQLNKNIYVYIAGIIAATFISAYPIQSRLNLIPKIFTIVLSVFLSIYQIFGVAFQYLSAINKPLDPIFIETFGLKKILLVMFIFVSLAIAIYFVIEKIILILQKITFKSAKQSSYKNIFLFFLIAFLPWYLLYFPGAVLWDGADMLNEFFRSIMPYDAVTHFYGSSFANISQQFYDTNHHPFINQLFLGGGYKIGHFLFGTDTGGVATAIFIQLLVVSASFSFLIYRLQRLQINGARYFKWFLAFFPIFGYWTIAIDKTAFGMALFALFVTSLLPIALNNKNNIKNYLELFATSSLIMLARNDAILYVIFSWLVILFFKDIRKWGSAILIGSAIFTVVLTKIISTSLQILPTEKVEILAIPMHQTVRPLLFNNGDSAQIKDEENKLSVFMDIEKAKQVYSPGHYDNVKHSVYTYPIDFFQSGKTYQHQLSAINNMPINQESGDFYKIWLSSVISHPQNSVAAFFGNNSGYFSLTASSFPALFDLTGYANYEATSLFDGIHYHKKQFEIVTIMQNILHIVGEIPILNLLIITAFWSIFSLTIFILLIQRKQNRLLIIASVSLAIIAVAVVSPIDDLLRYFNNLAILTPALFLISSSKK